ncbi:MAG: hypothetical protein HY760_07540 [Nitrospirae bacterium]|nr:hypothetical protein [Nitrospirota bacterium]
MSERGKKRVVVTGMGLITPIGSGKEAYWESVSKGRSGVKRVTQLDTSAYRTKIAGIVEDFDPKEFLDAKQVKRMDRFSHFAVAATAMAVEDGALRIDDEAREKVGVILGSAVAGILSHETAAEEHFLRGHRHVKGEGAGMLVLESLEHARGRSARIHGEIIGYGTTCDTSHLTFPNKEQEIRAVRIALADADIEPKEVDYINAHGTGTQANDKTETEVIKDVFGADAYSMPISSTKSMIGHPLGASGAIELITCLLAMEHRFIPPTINYEIPDPECDLDYVPNTGREGEIDIAMSDSFGFGGANAVLIVRKWKGTDDKEE